MFNLNYPLEILFASTVSFVKLTGKTHGHTWLIIFNVRRVQNTVSFLRHSRYSVPAGINSGRKLKAAAAVSGRLPAEIKTAARTSTSE